MRVLILSNFYPPYVIGGYEALCEETVSWLRSQGHIVQILTSTYGVPEATIEGSVSRVLELESDLDHYDPWRTLSYRFDQRRNIGYMQASISGFRPDVVFVWGMWNLSRALLDEVEGPGYPLVAYYLASPWPEEPSSLASYWDSSPRQPGRALPKRLLRSAVRWLIPEAWHPAPLRFEHAVCNTVSLRDGLTRAGHRLADAAILCEGIDLTPYRLMTPRQRTPGEPLRLVFVGRLGWHKGPHTIIEAMSELVNQRGRRQICLTICGGGQPEYKQHLLDLVANNNLSAHVTFRRPLPRPELPSFLAQFDALVLSSIWDEALARIMQEAMAAGLTVIGTPTGSTGEFLVEAETGLTFPPGDALSLADQIDRLADDPDLGLRLADAGRRLAFARFDIQRMTAEIERYLRVLAPPGILSGIPEPGPCQPALRILFVTNFYPPYVIGGWEQLVQDLVARLQARGHQTAVLCSTHGIGDRPDDETGVHRRLRLESDLNTYNLSDFFAGRMRRERDNRQALQQVITDFRPDVIFIHGMWNMTWAIPRLIEKLCPERVVYYIANDWPYAEDVHSAYWRSPARRPWRRLPKRIVGAMVLFFLTRSRRRRPLRFERVMCVSQAMRNSLVSELGLPADQVRVVYNGIDVRRFVPASTWERLRPPHEGLSLIYVGAVVPHKGVHTAIEAMQRLSLDPGATGFTLTIVGSGHPDYEVRLRALAAAIQPPDRIRFLGRVSAAAIPELLRQHDILVFPSVWEEPLARAMQEGMACGLVVVGTTTGGSGELLVEGETGLTFAPEDAAGLAAQVLRLAADPELRSRLAAAGRRVVWERFDIERMVNQVETCLLDIAGAVGTPH